LVLTQLALLCTAAGAVAGAVAAARTRRLLPSLPLAVDFWLAAGLLRLSGDPTWQTIASAACIIAVRQIVRLGLRQAS
jgi:hypothetical protein